MPATRTMIERPQDADDVEALLDLCFAPGRGALSSYQLRRDVAPIGELCTLARDDYDAVVASIRFWPVRIGTAGHPALLLGPIAVHPTRQGEGLGAQLMRETLDKARDLGWERVILVGDAPYYGRFGFSRALASALDYPKPVNFDRLLAKELRPGAMAGVSGMTRRWVD